MTIEDTRSDRITAGLILVSDETAKRWLDRNTRNRTISPATVERYRRDMAAGRWVYAADPIRFDTDGNLLDGQHRLAALTQIPGLTLPMLVVRGLPSEAQMVMDQGRRRGAAGQLSLLGYKNSANIAAAIRLYLIWREGLMFRDSKLSNQLITVAQIEAWAEANPTLVEVASSVIHECRASDAPPSVGMAAAIRFAEIDTAATSEFFRLLASGAGVEGHPIVTLDKRLRRIRRERINVSSRDYIAFFVLAWNGWRQGQSFSKFQRPRGGSWTVENFPEPK